MIKKILLLFILINTSLFSSKIDFTEEEKSFIKTSPKIKIASMNTYTPFSFIKNGKKIGFTQDLIEIISNESGLKFEKFGGPWPEVYKLFQDGKVDVISEISYRKSRESFTSFSDAYYQVPIGIFTRKEFGTYRSLNDLKNKRIGVIKNTYITEIFKKENLDFVEFDKANERFKALDNGEIDAVISNALNMHKVKELMLSNIKLAGTFVHPDTKKEDLRFGVRKENPLLSSIINKTLTSIPFSIMSQLEENWILNLNELKSYNKLTSKEIEFIKKQKKIRFGIRTNRPPFSFYENGKVSGIAVDYIKKSAKNSGLEIEFVYEEMSLPNAYKMIETREKFDTILFTIKNVENDKKFSIGESYLSYPMMIIKHKESPYIGSMKDLRNKTIVLEKYFATNKWIKRDYPSIKIVNVKNTTEALKYINDGKADAYVGNLAVSNYLSVFGGLKNLKVAGPSDYENINYHFVAPRQWPELTSILSKGFKQISPIEHSAIQQKWFSLQIIDKVDYSLVLKIILISVLIILWILWWNRKLSLEKNRTNIALRKLEEIQKDLKEKENALRVNNSRFEKSELVGNVGSWEYNIETQSYWGSTQSKVIFGMDVNSNIFTAEMVESCMIEQKRIHKALVDLLEKGIEYNLEYEINPYDGSKSRILSSIATIEYDNQNKPIKVVGLIQDITQRKVLEEKFNRYFQLSLNLQLISTTEGIILELNSASKSILGYTNDGLKGTMFLDLVHPDDKQNTIEEMSKLSKGENVYFFENRYRHKDGHYIDLVWSATTDSSNNLIYATAQDITSFKKIESEQKKKDKLLYEQTKLASMGEMIGNIAHQWRQPLSIISTGATGMQTQKEYGLLSDDIFNDTCTAINNNAQYLSRTIDDFRNFIKGDRSKKVFNLRDDINSFLHLVEGTIKNHHIEIIKDIQEDIQINGYSNELIQCFINIFNNSKYALEDKENKLIFLTTLIDKDSIIIKIKDNGGGIDTKILHKVFEPYFTTKHQSKGTGLGLHITYKLIVEGMNGTIKAQNTEYRHNDKSYVGAEFIITLPSK